MDSLEQGSGKYTLEVSLESLHQQTRDWLSTVAFWQTELRFFIQLLDKNFLLSGKDYEAEKLEDLEAKVENYMDELKWKFEDALRKHEKYLSELLDEDEGFQDETYRDEHRKYSGKMKTMQKELRMLKTEVFKFVEGVPSGKLVG